MPHYRFPDPKLRSVKKPNDDCHRGKIVGLYNQAHGTERAYLTQEIQTWFEKTAIRLGWVSVVFGPNSATLTADVTLKRKDVNAGKSDNVVSLTRPHRVNR